MAERNGNCFPVRLSCKAIETKTKINFAERESRILALAKVLVRCRKIFSLQVAFPSCSEKKGLEKAWKVSEPKMMIRRPLALGGGENYWKQF